MWFRSALVILSIVISVSAFSNEAPVVDASDQAEAASSGGTSNSSSNEQSDGGGWQTVSGPDSSSADDAKSPPAASVQNIRDSSASPDVSGSIDKRVGRLEQQVANYNQMNLPQQVTDLQNKIAQLQGQHEEDQHAIKTLTDQQKLFYQDVEQQLAQLQQGRQQDASGATLKKTPLLSTQASTSDDAAPPAKPETEFARATKKQQPPADDVVPDSANDTSKSSSALSTKQASAVDTTAAATTDTPSKTTLLSDADTYNKAFRALSGKHYSDAQTQFKNYLTLYPKGSFAVSAHFWLGEIGLMHEKYDVAMKQFQTVVSNYPNSKKVADAKLKIAMIHAATGKVEVARDEFAQIRKNYPGTTAAQLSSIRLQQLANATSVNVQ